MMTHAIVHPHIHEQLLHAGHDDPVVREHLESIASAVERVLGASLHALVLVGSFARREGVLVRRASAWSPLNDYDLVAVVRGPARLFRVPVQTAVDAVNTQLAIHSEVWTIPYDTLRTPPRTLFWLDVAQGAGVVIRGQPDALQHIRSLGVRDISLEEGSRLLTNRCVGLALSALEPDDADAMIRHVHKAVLACGDARLFSTALYPFDLDARALQLELLADGPNVGEALARAYRQALLWKRGEVVMHYNAELLRWFHRLRSDIQQWHLSWEHARTQAPLEPIAFATWNRHHLSELRDVHPLLRLMHHTMGRVDSNRWTHARERLTRAAVLLAYATENADARSAAAALLGLSSHQTDSVSLARGLRSLAARGG